MFTLEKAKKELDFLLTNINPKDSNLIRRNLSIDQRSDHIEFRTSNIGTDAIFIAKDWQEGSPHRIQITGLIKKSDIRASNEIMMNGEFLFWNELPVKSAGILLFSAKNVLYKKKLNLPKGIVETLCYAEPFCGREELKPALCGVHVFNRGMVSEDDLDTVVVDSSNGHCLYRRELKVKTKKMFNFIVPATAIKTIQKMQKVAPIKSVVYMEDKISKHPYLVLTTDTCRLEIRCVDEHFPDCDAVFPIDTDLEAIEFNTKELLNILIKIRKDAKLNTYDKRLVLDKNQIIVWDDNKEHEEDATKYELPFEIPVGRRGFSSEFLYMILKNITSEECVWNFNTRQTGPNLFVPVNDTGTYLLMPIIVK